MQLIVIRGPYLNESIVCQEHESSEIPNGLGTPEQGLTEVTNVTHFGVNQTITPNIHISFSHLLGDIESKPNRKRSIKHYHRHRESHDQSWD